MPTIVNIFIFINRIGDIVFCYKQEYCLIQMRRLLKIVLRNTFLLPKAYSLDQIDGKLSTLNPLCSATGVLSQKKLEYYCSFTISWLKETVRWISPLHHYRVASSSCSR